VAALSVLRSGAELDRGRPSQPGHHAGSIAHQIVFKLQIPQGEEFFVLTGTAAASGSLPRPSNGHPVGRREV
jgi:hypothetical protein